MLDVNIVDVNNEVVGKKSLNAAVFGLEPDPGFIHRVLVALAAAQRAGTHSSKNRSQVSGGGRKPWRQKGTGRARQGSIRATQWRHGGIAHGPKPRSYATRINKKERRRALCMALSGHASGGSLTVIKDFALAAVKTKAFAEVARALGADHALFVLAEEDRNVMLSGRNLPHVKIVREGQVNLHDLLKYPRLVMTEDAIARLEERLA